jgi:cell division ATPase FtsA
MSKKSDRNLIVGLDIGTSKVVAIVGEMTPEEAWEWGAEQLAAVAEEWKADNPDWTPPAD